MQHFYRIVRFTLASIFFLSFNTLTAQVIYTVVGGGTGDGGPATGAALSYPFSVATDAAGNIYLADAGHNSIRKITTAGIISTIAGNGKAGFMGDGGPATAAELNGPISIAFDGAGNMYISDYGNNRIRMVNTTGIISTFAGNGNYGGLGDGGPATAAQFNTPQQIAFDHTGNFLYIADYSNDVIRMVDRNTGIISTVIGTMGVAGFYGDGKAASGAQLNFPTGVALDPMGNIYIADRSNYRIRVVGTNGIISTYAGTSTSGYNGDGGNADTTEFGYPNQLVADSSGNIYIADQNNNDIRLVNTLGIVSTIAGNVSLGGGYSGDGAAATLAQLNGPEGVSVDPAGNVYIADYNNGVIRKINTGGIISTMAGSNNSVSFSGDGGLGTNAIISNPTGVVRDKLGNVYFADQSNMRIRELNVSTHIITTIAGNGTSGFSGDGGAATASELGSPQALAIDDSGNIYIADVSNYRIRKITSATGIISTYAGFGNSGYNGENINADTLRMGNVNGLAVDTAGNVYFSDEDNSILRKINKATNLVTTIAGLPSNGGYNGDGLASATQLYFPMGLGVDKHGNVYFVDAGNVLLRKLVLSSDSIITIGGQYDNYGTPQVGSPVIATSIAAFYSPQGLTLDTAGNIYVTDQSNGNIVKITKNDSLTVLSGVGGVEGPGYNGDNIMANTAYLSNPNGVAVDDSGNVFLADAGNNRVREIRMTGPQITSQPVSTLTTCSGGYGNEIGIGVSGTGITYQWLVDSTGSGNNFQPITNGAEFSGATTDSLTITAINTYSLAFECSVNNGYIYSIIVNSTLTPPPVPNLSGPTDSICPGTLASLDAVDYGSGNTIKPLKGGHKPIPQYNGDIITWSTGEIDTTSNSNINVYPGVTTTYTASINNGGCTVSSSITVLVHNHTLKANALPSTELCKGTSVTLYGTGGSAGSYFWSGNNVYNGSNPFTFTADSSVSYYVSGYDASSGCSDSSLIRLTIVPTPTVTASATTDSICPGGSVTLNGSGAVTYAWSNGVTNNVAFSPSSSAVYHLTGTDANGCVGYASVPVIVNPLPVITVSPSSDPICQGAQETLTATGGVSYTWSNGVTNGVPFVPVSSATYSVTGTDKNGCTNNTSVSITVNSLPAITATAFPSAALCQGSSLALFGSGGSSYAWSGGVNNGVSFTPS
ncbi:MAG TPA: hypothetical protein VK783_03290, partial [Bacteroidia bacterium]|nr:hypothetical protein [Bacteroidia bacterium]